MTDPDRPTIEDVCTSIAEADTIGEAIRYAVFHDQPNEVLVGALEDRIWDEPDLARARERDRDLARQAKMDAFIERRDALELAITYKRDRPTDQTPVEIETLAKHFHDILTGRLDATDAGRNPDVWNDPNYGKRRKKGVDELIRDTSVVLGGPPYRPPYPVHPHHGATVYREGNRIRRTDGTGYSDSVSDSSIQRHRDDAARHGRLVDAAFAAAVLYIRAYERIGAPGQ